MGKWNLVSRCYLRKNAREGSSPAGVAESGRPGGPKDPECRVGRARALCMQRARTLFCFCRPWDHAPRIDLRDMDLEMESWSGDSGLDGQIRGE